MMYENCAEETLLEYWRSGDRDAADELLRRCKPMLGAFFRRRTTQNVDELVQRTLVACVQSIDHFEGRSTFKAFLFGIARNQFLMNLRTRPTAEQQAPTSTFPEDSPSQLVASKEELKILVQALNATSGPFRQVLRMFYWDDLSVEEIAKTLDVPAGTVKSRLGRGRLMIKAKIIEATGSTNGLVRKLVDLIPPVDLDAAPKSGT
jgi:RNA polymerase sigma-70 factor (ECF subfamily)